MGRGTCWQIYADRRHSLKIFTDAINNHLHLKEEFPKADTWTLQNGADTVQIHVGGRYVLNSVGMFRRLATLDQGLILLPKAVVADDLARGELQHVLPGWQGKPMPVYAFTETRLLPAKTQRFIEFLKERLSALD